MSAQTTFEMTSPPHLLDLLIFLLFLPAKTKTLHVLPLSLLPLSSSLSLTTPPPSLSPSLHHSRSRAPAVAEVLQALVTSVKAMVKKTFSEAQVFKHYGTVPLITAPLFSFFYCFSFLS